MKLDHIKSIRLNRLKNFIVPCLVGAIFIYFVFHLLYGSRGLFAYWNIKKQLVESRSYLCNLQAKSLRIGNDVKLLSSGSLDLDMLDEKARNILGFSNKDEEIFLIEKE